ncbi:hypothetical protein HMPREF0262_00327 [Clostridium sp. ATCC 29733]|nr:hypothetical protein HMPREF0262_00327 [Clostridium sp. ATCC 29733]
MGGVFFTGHLFSSGGDAVLYCISLPHFFLFIKAKGGETRRKRGPFFPVRRGLAGGWEWRLSRRGKLAVTGGVQDSCFTRLLQTLYPNGVLAAPPPLYNRAMERNQI